MKKYELNGLGKDFIFEAESEEAATLDYINQVGGFKTTDQYEAYCEQININ